MESGGSMVHSQGLSNNPYSNLNQPNYSDWHFFFKIYSIIASNLHLDLPKDLIPVGLPAKILKVPLPSSILATFPAINQLH